jgi:hypothetical protein
MSAAASAPEHAKPLLMQVSVFRTDGDFSFFVFFPDT